MNRTPDVSTIPQSIGEYLVPLAETQVVYGDRILREMVLTNPKDSGQVVTVYVKSGTGVYLWYGDLPPGGTVSYNGSRLMAGGIIWKASVNAVVSAGLRWL